MYTPEGYLKDPPDAICPYCERSGVSCSYVNSLSRAWARGACANKYQKKIKYNETSECQGEGKESSEMG
jgi:hypothetical protein